jgi:hypothetical protein
LPALCASARIATLARLHLPLSREGLVLPAGTLSALSQAEDTSQQLRAPFNDPRAERHWPRSRSYNLKHVKVEIHIDWEKKAVAGVSTLTLAPLNDGLTHLQVDADAPAGGRGRDED